MKKTGVVLVCYHTPDETVSCMNMYLDMKNIDHIVIVDSCSTKTTKSKFERIRNERVSFIFLNENTGYSKGNNIGAKFLIEKYNVDYIIISNSDIIVEEYVINQCIQNLEDNSQLGAAAPIMIDPYGKKFQFRFLDLGYIRITLRIFFPESLIDTFYNLFISKKRKNESFVLQKMLPGSFFIIKSEAFQECGGFDEKIFLYREEEILGQRLLSKCYQLAILTKCSFVHNHNYKRDSAMIRINRNKIAIQSERIFFVDYYHSSYIQLLYLKIMQYIYLYSRYLGWVLRDCKNKHQKK